MRIAYLGPAGTFTEDALREAAPEGELRAAADGDRSTTRSSRSSAARPSGRWSRSRTRSRARSGSTLDTLAFDAEAVTIVGEHDYRGAGPPDRPRGDRARARSRRCSPTPSRSPSAPRFLREQLPRVERRSVSSTAAAVRMVERVGAALGGDRRARGGRALRLRDPARGDRGRGRQRHPLRLDRPGRDRARGRRAVEDLAGLLRARRGPPRRPGRRPAASSPSRGDQPDAGSSRGRCARASAATCSSATSRASETEPAVAEAIAALRTKAESVRILGSYPVG